MTMEPKEMQLNITVSNSIVSASHGSVTFGNVYHLASPPINHALDSMANIARGMVLIDHLFRNYFPVRRLNWRLATTVKQYSLAFRYKHGIGTKKNLAKAAHLFDLAAANWGNVNAQYQIGMYYYNRNEFNKAVYWLECTAKQGHIQAQWQLGKHYLNLSTDLHINIGLYLDFQDAYTKVFNAFFEFSTLNLNTINRAVRAKGMAWLERAAQRNNRSKIVLAFCYLACGKFGKAIEFLEDILDNPISPLEVTANELTENDLIKQESFLLYILGALHFQYGEKEKSIDCLKSAEHLKNAQAQYTLGIIFYENGYPNVVAKNPKKAADLYQSAAGRGHKDAQWRLGYCYEHGIGREKNLSESIRYYYFSEKKGHINAKNSLDALLKKSPGLATILKALEQEEKTKSEQTATIAGHGLFSKSTFIENKKEDPIPEDENSIRSKL